MQSASFKIISEVLAKKFLQLMTSFKLLKKIERKIPLDLEMF